MTPAATTADTLLIPRIYAHDMRPFEIQCGMAAAGLISRETLAASCSITAYQQMCSCCVVLTVYTHTQVLEWTVGDSFDFAMVLCSFLLGAGFDAYVVWGTAPGQVFPAYTLYIFQLVGVKYPGIKEYIYKYMYTQYARVYITIAAILGKSEHGSTHAMSRRILPGEIRKPNSIGSGGAVRSMPPSSVVLFEVPR